jgi:hypothetical protein
MAACLIICWEIFEIRSEWHQSWYTWPQSKHLCVLMVRKAKVSFCGFHQFLFLSMDIWGASVFVLLWILWIITANNYKWNYCATLLWIMRPGEVSASWVLADVCSAWVTQYPLISTVEGSARNLKTWVWIFAHYQCWESNPGFAHSGQALCHWLHHQSSTFHFLFFPFFF